MFAYNARGDLLRKAERLSEVASKMPASPERTLIDNLRDDYATSWAMNHMAPVHLAYRIWAYIFFGLGVIVTAWWLTLDDKYEDERWYDLLFLAGPALSIAAAAVWLARGRRRQRWIQRERETRALRVLQHSRLHDAVYPKSRDRDQGAAPTE